MRHYTGKVWNKVERKNTVQTRNLKDIIYVFFNLKRKKVSDDE